MVKKDDFIHTIEKFENTNSQIEFKLLTADKCKKDRSNSILCKLIEQDLDTNCKDENDEDEDMEYSGSDESDISDLDTSYQERSSNGFPICRGCNKEVSGKYYLRVNETSWHEECLKCNYCNVNLEMQQTCFIKKRQVLCKNDYYNDLFRHFGINCSKCSRNIQSSDWVRRAKNNVYHLACFACDTCKRQLSTGEEFALQNNKLLCKTHYCEYVDGDNGSKEDHMKSSKNKRVRTTFTEEQLQILQANFDVDSNPDGQDLERIAQVTGLSKRVTQVWFQNSRARQKKYKEKKISGYENDMSNEDTWTNDDTKHSNSKKRVKRNRNKNNDMNESWSSESNDANLLGYDDDTDFEN